VPFETGHFGGVPPDEYVVIIPLADNFNLSADNLPQVDVQEARLAIYSKENYYPLRDKITAALLDEDFTITDRRYIEFESDTRFHHIVIDSQKAYEME
ncbi:MAG: hypothetical protein FWF80_04790, partial [Defluviitaleaceae bacterium]|nr:hypothetical protein [Defluviitaleaceae bacterium]